MSNNPQTPKIILHDHCEVDADGRGSFLKEYAVGGETYRIAEKRAPLWAIFQSARYGEPILATFEEYMNTEYMVKAEQIADEILKKAVYNLGIKLADIQTEERNRSQSIAYTKDMVCADKVELKDMFEWADKIHQFIKGVKPDTGADNEP